MLKHAIHGNVVEPPIMDITISEYQHSHYLEQAGLLLIAMELYPLKCRYLHFQTTDIFLNPEFLTHAIL